MLQQLAKPLAGLVVLIVLVSIVLSMIPFMGGIFGADIVAGLAAVVSSAWILIPTAIVLFFLGQAPLPKLLIAWVAMMTIAYIVLYGGITL